ncbi:Utp14 protein-domain-containing protein [Dactylonectria estremocensis]|uniref:Utp14 protein-domain-containing protein n=1 Tax=Dactylonectria estremocensis TaxID=1079267 RepID=A0A9P9JEU4_9HYPO|nr:Utp14 protein-domain-containing protein [Dactylonectria estremocensis]
MGGRQAHGRSLIAGPKGKAAATNKKSKARSQKNALDAFGIAQEKFAPRQKQTPRARNLDAEIERKHGRDDEDEDEEDEEEEEEPQRKKAKPSRPTGDDADDGSDSEGNEWRLGGLRDDDDDSEIESDDAFGESDQEKMQGYTFRGSKSTQKDDDSDSDDSQDDEGETLGAEAIDLATALDQFEESSEEEPDNKDQSGSSESDDDASDESEDDDEDDDDSEDEDAIPEKLQALQGLIAGYGGEEKEDGTKTKSKAKISLSDLGLSGINDQNVKKSMKLLNKEDKETRPGAANKLDIPLARRQQARLDRSAAYEKTNETLDRWNETVKQNRRAEHLIFPLPQNSATAGLDTTEIQPLSTRNPTNELESTIMGIMAQSGLSLEKPQKQRAKEFDDEGNELSRKEILARKRMERELNSRETKRAARIKKIKSKAYHRVHRKQRERDEIATKEAMEEAGEIDSEEEREAQDRRRALERVGQRHKDSKWAKIGGKAKRAVWDEDFRTGLTEMARKDEELRRRKEGRSGLDDSSSDSDSDNGDASLRRQLKELEDEDEEPQTGLMGMKFMQKAEAAKKQANDALVKQIRRELDEEESEGSGDDDEREEVGRRQYGAADGKPFAPTTESSSKKAKKRRSDDDDDDDDDDDVVITTKGSTTVVPNTTATDLSASTAASTAGAWSRGEARRKKRDKSSSRIEDLDLTANVIVASRPKKSKLVSKARNGAAQDDANSDDSDADQHLPMAIRDQEMVARAFAGEDVVGEFEREKADVAEADDDKVIDNTLPGWGSWVGEGVSSREQKRHQGRFLTKVEGIKKKNRKDAKLDKVIINEKRIKKNDRYLSSQLPHPFESREQYERSLRLPVGPEWMTKESFQDSTKPRVLMKQGIIAPMSKPMI